jgi:hypothetical protein
MGLAQSALAAFAIAPASPPDRREAEHGVAGFPRGEFDCANSTACSGS